MRRLAVHSAAFLLLPLVASCLGSAPSPTPSPPTVPNACAGVQAPTAVASGLFEGSNALAHVVRLVCNADHQPALERERVPGTAGHDEAAAYIASTLAAAGWGARFENFTGREYSALPKGGVASYAARCNGVNRARLDALPFANVWAERGAGPGRWILLAHYDTKRYASQDADAENRTRQVPGANDGASGVGVLLELARHLQKVPPNLTVELLFTDGEDGFEDCHPLAGSLVHTARLDAGRRNATRAVVLLDMVGDPEARFCVSANDATLEGRLSNASRAENVSALSDLPRCTVVDDHTPFVEAGMPALDLIDYRPPFPPYWHTRADTPDKLSSAMLGDVGRVVGRLVQDAGG